MASIVKVAALFVAAGGCYDGLDDVEPWTVERDARRYAGPYPVVGHPPCATWGKYAQAGLTLRALGDDDGCFAAALAAVRRWGGVLEHPAYSAAWRAFDLTAPGRRGWTAADFSGGWTCFVEQGLYGHQARKPTWLLGYRVALPSLRWGCGVAARPCENMSHRERAATPLAFRDLLLAMARSVQPERSCT